MNEYFSNALTAYAFAMGLKYTGIFAFRNRDRKLDSAWLLPTPFDIVAYGIKKLKREKVAEQMPISEAYEVS